MIRRITLHWSKECVQPFYIGGHVMHVRQSDKIILWVSSFEHDYETPSLYNSNRRNLEGWILIGVSSTHHTTSCSFFALSTECTHSWRNWGVEDAEQ